MLVRQKVMAMKSLQHCYHHCTGKRQELGKRRFVTVCQRNHKHGIHYTADQFKIQNIILGTKLPTSLHALGKTIL